MRSFSLLALAGLAYAASAKVTAIEKVITLLKELSAKIEEEGTSEAASYDKYACFCKKHADDKLYAIEKSTEKISNLDAQIESLEGEIGELNNAIKELGDAIEKAEGEIKTKNEKRAEEHAAYVKARDDMQAAINAVDGAIKALKESKGAMSEAKLQLIQQAIAFGEMHGVSTSQLQKMVQPSGGAAPKYEYHANEIIATLTDLKKQFKASLVEMNNEEADIKQQHGLSVQALTNQKNFDEAEKAEKEEVLGKKEAEKAQAEQDRTDETAEKGADQAFLDDLTGQCEQKATDYDTRSKNRANELTAISEALHALETGVKPNYGSNQKLVGLLQKGNDDDAEEAEDSESYMLTDAEKKASKDEPEDEEEGSEEGEGEEEEEPEDFLQISASSVNSKVFNLIKKAAKSLKSRELTLLALKLKEDHFVKVRGLIKDLITRLEDQAKAEDTLKAYCDEEMGKAITKRDDAKAAQEAAGAAIAEAKALIQQLADEIADLGRQIAALNKALNEATKLRAEERAENEKTLADAEAGKEAVEQAISTLKAFYGSFVQTSFVQIRAHQPAATEGYEKTFGKNAARDGKTVGDLAPEIFEHGDDDASKYDESKGIIGLLDVIQSDFEGTIEATTSEEEEAETNFGKFKTDTETDIEEKETTKKNKEDKKVETEDELLTQQGNLADETENLELAEKALAGLKSQCVDGAETYEERVAKREQEIESLKQAMEILDNWKTGFMQRN